MGRADIITLASSPAPIPRLSGFGTNDTSALSTSTDMSVPDSVGSVVVGSMDFDPPALTAGASPLHESLAERIGCGAGPTTPFPTEAMQCDATGRHIIDARMENSSCDLGLSPEELIAKEEDITAAHHRIALQGLSHGRRQNRQALTPLGEGKRAPIFWDRDSISYPYEMRRRTRPCSQRRVIWKELRCLLRGRRRLGWIQTRVGVVGGFGCLGRPWVL